MFGGPRSPPVHGPYWVPICYLCGKSQRIRLLKDMNYEIVPGYIWCCGPCENLYRYRRQKIPPKSTWHINRKFGHESINSKQRRVDYL